MIESIVLSVMGVCVCGLTSLSSGMLLLRDHSWLLAIFTREGNTWTKSHHFLIM